jgi:mycothiol synthase
MRTDIRLRPAEEDDVSALVGLFRRAWEENATPGPSEAETREWVTNPTWRGRENGRVAIVGGDLVGAAGLWDEDDARERVFMNVTVHPPDADVAEALLDWAEARGAEIVAGEGLLRAAAMSGDALGHELRRRGYELVRHFFTMEIALADEPPAPEWPEGIVVRTLVPGEERRVYEAMNEAFADHWDFRPIAFDRWRAFMTDSADHDPSLWFLALDGDEIAGAALCRSERRPGTAHVGVLGVRPGWRRRGLARALLLHAFGDFRRRGRAKADLGVGAENPTGAVRLYEQAGMYVAARMDTYEKRLG